MAVVYANSTIYQLSASILYPSPSDTRSELNSDSIDLEHCAA